MMKLISSATETIIEIETSPLLNPQPLSTHQNTEIIMYIKLVINKVLAIAGKIGFGKIEDSLEAFYITCLQ